ncbi:DUF192 domain-containing protein [archaeon]|nr:DUF192 domain-containing protein [archaeon]
MPEFLKAYMLIRVRNKTLKVEVADSWSKRFRGLMFRSKPIALLLALPSEGRTNSAIHSNFVFFRFDAVFVNEQKRIVDVRANIRPFTLAVVPRRPARYVLELPAGTAGRMNVHVGLRVYFLTH